MKKHRIALLAVLIAVYVAGVAILGVYGLSRHKPSDSGKLQVVAGENFWGSILSQIGGDKVEVTSIISDSNADPHLYQSDVHDALALSQAKLVVANGLGYDDFLGKLMSANPSKQRSVLTVSGMLHVTGNDANPHLWYDIPRIPAVAQAFEQALAAKDPADVAVFAANLKTFDASLQPLLTKMNDIKTQYSGVPVAYTERVPGYLLTDIGLSVKTPADFASAIEEGNDPSPADQSTMSNLITTRSIKVLLYNAQATSPVTQHIRSLAQQHNIPVVGVTETIPAGFSTYQAWQLAQLNALEQALRYYE